MSLQNLQQTFVQMKLKIKKNMMIYKTFLLKNICIILHLTLRSSRSVVSSQYHFHKECDNLIKMRPFYSRFIYMKQNQKSKQQKLFFIFIFQKFCIRHKNPFLLV